MWRDVLAALPNLPTAAERRRLNYRLWRDALAALPNLPSADDADGVPRMDVRLRMNHRPPEDERPAVPTNSEKEMDEAHVSEKG